MNMSLAACTDVLVARSWRDMSEVTILVDYRERSSRVPNRLLALGASVVERHLDVADYVLSERVGVERKTASDFVASLVKKRFSLQLDRLRQAFPRPLYVIEGRHLYGIRDVHPNFIRGALATLAITWGIPTVFTQNPEDTAELFFLIARREQTTGDSAVAESKVGYPSIGTSRRLPLPEQQLRVLQAMPLIGSYRARQLLRHFGSIEALVAASETDLVNVPGIGRSTARKIKEILGSAFSKPPAD